MQTVSLLPKTAVPVAQFIRDRLPFLDITNGPWVGGGAARLAYENAQSFDGSDIDVFFQTRASFDSIRARMKLAYGEFEVLGLEPDIHSAKFMVHNGSNPITVQLIRKDTYLNYEQLFRDFDFTACMFVTDGRVVIASPDGIKALNNRELIFSEQSRPEKMKHNRIKAGRLSKYCARGFVPGPGVLTKMLAVDHPKFAEHYKNANDERNY